MNLGSAEAFWAMGGHGFYVWGSYAVATVLMLVEGLLVLQRHRQAKRDAQRAREDQGGGS